MARNKTDDSDPKRKRPKAPPRTKLTPVGGQKIKLSDAGNGKSARRSSKYPGL